MKKVWIALTTVLVTFVTIQFVMPPSGWAVERAEAEETARLLAKLLKAGRSVIEQNQLLIDHTLGITDHFLADEHEGRQHFFSLEWHRDRRRGALQLREIKTGLLAKFLNELLLKHLGRKSLVSLLWIVNQLLILLNDRSAGLEQFGQ